jgi:hypothetical protein
MTVSPAMLEWMDWSPPALLEPIPHKEGASRSRRGFLPDPRRRRRD